MLSRWFTRLAIAAVASLVLGLTASGLSAQTPVRGGTLTVAISDLRLCL